MKSTIKTVIKIAAVLLLIFSGFGFLPVILGGYAALRGVDLVSAVIGKLRGRRQEQETADKEILRRNAAEHKANVRRKYWDRKNEQWDVHQFPLDMYPMASFVDENGERITRFSCSGMDNVVTGRVLRGSFGRDSVEFATVISDSRVAEEMSSYVKANGLLGVRVVREDDDKFSVISDNAVDMNTIIKQFYPPKDMTIKREITTTRQYIVSGCRSYEEALEKFKANPVMYGPSDAANVFVSYKDTVDGVEDHAFMKSGVSLDASSMLQLGQYIINAETTEVYSRHVSVSTGIDCTDEAARSRASEYIDEHGFSFEDLVEDQCVVEPVLSCGNMAASRFVECGGQMMEYIENDSVELDRTGANLILRFRSVYEFMDVVSGNVSVQGRMVLVDKHVPSPVEGEFVLSVPADASLINSLHVMGEAPSSIVREYAEAGMTMEDANRICVMDRIRQDGYLTARLTDNPDFSGACVNGVPVEQFRQRMTCEDKVCEGCILEDDSRVSQWLEDAARIRSVDMELDMKQGTLTVHSKIARDDERVDTRVITKMLTAEETEAMAARGMASDMELKDFLMQAYPDCFLSYRDTAPSAKTYCFASEEKYRSIFHDPVEAFVANRKPVLEKDWKEQQAMERKQRREVRKQNGQVSSKQSRNHSI